MRKKLLTYGIWLLLMTCVLTRPVSAQQMSLSIYPPLIKATIKPSKSFIVAFTVKNEGDPVFIKPLIRSFSPTGILGNIAIGSDAQGPIQFSLDNSVISFNEPFFLKTKQSEQLLLRIRVPEGAPYGDYYYTLLAQTEQMPGLIGSHGATSIAAIGSTLLISVSPTEKMETQPTIESIVLVPRKSFFFLPQHLYDSSDVIGVKVLARNDGKHRYTIKGHLEISSGIGKKDIHTFVEEEILANSTRLVRASDSAQLECNRSSVKNICRNGPFSALLQSFSIGKKEITAVLTLDGQTISTLKVTAVLFPLKLMCGIVLLLTAVIILSLAFSKKQISADTPSDRLSK